METQIQKCRELLDSFLSRWPLCVVEKMTLNDYVGINDRNTFCQWIETKTRDLGSIKGWSSIKFGIYKRRDKTRRLKNFANDDQYSWMRHYGDTRGKAFREIRKQLISTIHLADNGKFELIDQLNLPNLFKWKVAFLYSNERLIPIFKKEILFKIANHYGLRTDRNTTISHIQRLLISKKTSKDNVFNYASSLFNRFGGKPRDESKGKKTTRVLNKRKKHSRVPASKKSTATQVRTFSGSYRAAQRHNLLQEALKKKLETNFGAQSVILEEDYVDIKLSLPNELVLYEIKSSSYAGDCVTEALGQILLYRSHIQDKRPIRVIVAGQYPPNDDEREYIDYIKSVLDLPFDYETIALEQNAV